ncbi:MAG: NAD-dependent epimerase/dehydratase family protein [Gemmatimonadaceae bacterium]|nr:NAD-dependent epimerase/dehydratase family protein [Gemmatimonadaceae bacterium]
MQRQRIVVLGAGYVGRAVAASAAQAGHEVWAVRRAAVTEAGGGVQWCRGDVTTGHIEGLPAALDVVVLTIAPGASGNYDTVYPPAAAAALVLARATGAARVVYTSSTGVYGGRDGVWVAEASPRRGAGAGNDALRRAEDVLLESGFPMHVLRVAGIYGPGRDPRSRFRDAQALAQRGEYWVNLAHRDDIVAAVRHVSGGAAAQRILNVSDGTPAQAAEICRWLARADGLDGAALHFTNDATPARNDQRVSNAALVSTGWRASYPSFREGFSTGC